MCSVFLFHSIAMLFGFGLHCCTFLTTLWMHSSNNLTYSQIFRSHSLVSVSILIIVIRYLHSILCLSDDLVCIVCVCMLFSVDGLFVCLFVRCVSKWAQKIKVRSYAWICSSVCVCVCASATTIISENQINFWTITFFFRLPTPHRATAHDVFSSLHSNVN